MPAHESLWVATTEESASGPLLLKRAGLRVAVVEAGGVSHGTTGHTTAKV